MENSIPNNNPKFSNFEEKLKSYFEARKDIDFAIVFGSYANEKNRPFSDLDIGIHTKVDLSLLQIGSTIDDLESITNIKIDLLVLNEIYEENSYIVNWFLLKEKTNPELILTEDLQMIYIELPKFHKDSIDKLESGMDIWLFLLKNSQTLTEEDTLKLKQKLPDLQNAFGVLESLNQRIYL